MSFKLDFTVEDHIYANRTGNLRAEAVGVVKGEKHFPVFEENRVFKPLTKSKPFSTPLFAYAEVFWSGVINGFFVQAPVYHLAFCRGYEKESGKYYDYGTVSPLICHKGQHLLNLLEFFRKYPDDRVDIDQYVNYCQMFYDYRDIFESGYFREHRETAEELAMQVLISVLKGDQNYHYENIAFVCDDSGEILGMAPVIDHEFSTYFMFPDKFSRHIYWFDELERSIQGRPVQSGEYDYITNETERHLMEKSAVCLHGNLLYIREYYPEVTDKFLKKLEQFETALQENREQFYLEKNPEYPYYANSMGFMVGKARYKDHDEQKAEEYETQYGGKGKEINFEIINSQIIYEIKKVIWDMKNILIQR